MKGQAQEPPEFPCPKCKAPVYLGGTESFFCCGCGYWENSLGEKGYLKTHANTKPILRTPMQYAASDREIKTHIKRYDEIEKLLPPRLFNWLNNNLLELTRALELVQKDERFSRDNATEATNIYKPLYRFKTLVFDMPPKHDEPPKREDSGNEGSDGMTKTKDLEGQGEPEEAHEHEKAGSEEEGLQPRASSESASKQKRNSGTNTRTS